MSLDSRETDILRKRLIPSPRELRFTGEGFYKLVDGCRVTIKGIDTSVAESLFFDYWNVRPEIKVVPAEKAMTEEEYDIEVSSSRLTFSAGGNKALTNALKTLRQIAEPERGVLVFHHYLLPEFHLHDSPALDFRGIHLCVFPETPAWEIEKKLRLAAFWKFNYCVVEFWGTYPFKVFPELCWDEHRIERETVKKWVRIAKSAGLTLIPQFNVLGHAAMSRNRCDKHTVLDFHPELASLFEPEGWTWCISNPETRKLLDGIILELLDLFDNPPFFHIGCDESDDLGHCILCRKRNPRELVSTHLRHIFTLLKQCGAQPIMWHDMLLERDDPRWKDCTANGHSSLESESLCGEIPRDVLIADWCYGWPDGNAEPALPSLDYFKKCGFGVLASPWCTPAGIRGLARAVQSRRLTGLLATTWNKTSANDFFKIFFHAAKAAWECSEYLPETLQDRLVFTRHLRLTGNDMGISEYHQTGSVAEQVPSIPHF
jgi:hypothetical protein